MFEIALRSLVYDIGKLLAAVAGVAFATILVVVQLGLYEGFLDSSSSLIKHVGGDVWVMAKGVQVLDNGEPLAAGTKGVLKGHPCVERVRSVVYGWSTVSKRSGAKASVQIVALDEAGREAFPWSLSRGLPSDLDAPARVTIDEFDREGLELPRDAVGQTMQVGGLQAKVAAVTIGIRSFTLQPFLFAQPAFARSALSMDTGESTFLLLDLRTPSCTRDVLAFATRSHDLQALTADDFRQRTEDYWVNGSGAGAALAFSAMLGLLVGAVVVGQTLYAMTKEHARELATLKAMGATAGQLAAYVAWQAGALASVGGTVGLLIALGLARLVASAGLTVILSPGVITVGLVTVFAMCALASVGSLQKILRLDPASGFA